MDSRLEECTNENDIGLSDRLETANMFLERIDNNLERIANALEILAECTAVEYKGRIFCTSASVYNMV